MEMAIWRRGNDGDGFPFEKGDVQAIEEDGYRWDEIVTLNPAIAIIRVPLLLPTYVDAMLFRSPFAGGRMREYMVDVDSLPITGLSAITTDQIVASSRHK